MNVYEQFCLMFAQFEAKRSASIKGSLQPYAMQPSPPQKIACLALWKLSVKRNMRCTQHNAARFILKGSLENNLWVVFAFRAPTAPGILLLK